MLKKIIFRALLNFQFAFVLFWAMCLFSGAKLSPEVMWRVILQIALGERLATACFFTEASGIIHNGGQYRCLENQAWSIVETVLSCSFDCGFG